jgi:hypothetical protein
MGLFFPCALVPCDLWTSLRPTLVPEASMKSIAGLADANVPGMGSMNGQGFQ